AGQCGIRQSFAPRSWLTSVCMDQSSSTQMPPISSPRLPQPQEASCGVEARMSTIAPSPPPAPGLLPGAAPADAPVLSASKAPAAYTPLWLVGSGSSQGLFQSLGIRMPIATSYIATLLSQVSLNLELSDGEGRKDNALAGLAGLAAALSAFGLDAM